MQPSQPAAAPEAAPRSPADEARALSRVIWFAVVELAAIVVSVVIGFSVFSASLASGLGFVPGAGIGASGPNQREIQAMVQMFQSMTTLLPLVLLLALVASLLLWLGFRGLSTAGAREFSLPSKLILFMVAGPLFTIPGMVILFSAVVPLMESLAQQGGAGGFAGSLQGGAALMGVGGILEFIGLIGGQMLGVWRLGGRYHRDMLKVAAIFYIVPFLSMVAPILVLVGVSGAKKETGQQSRPAAP